VSPHLHVARGWFKRSCPTCKAPAGEGCSTPTGREASQVHAARLRPGRREFVWRPAVWDELERRGAIVAVVPFSGRAGTGGRTDTVRLLKLEDDELLEIERWTSRDELCYALEAPVWERASIGERLVAFSLASYADSEHRTFAGNPAAARAGLVKSAVRSASEAPYEPDLPPQQRIKWCLRCGSW